MINERRKFNPGNGFTQAPKRDPYDFVDDEDNIAEMRELKKKKEQKASKKVESYETIMKLGKQK